jgi:hypothetical protein
MKFPINEMSLSELADCCKSEIQHYKPGERYSEQCCLEICRRAMLQNDARAWEILMLRFHGIVLNWVRRHSQWEAARAIDSEENYVALTFERFWKVTVRNKNLEFATLGAALVFLRSCVNSVIIDTLRGQREVPLPEGFEREAPEPDESYQRWEVIKSFLPSEREQRLAYLLYYCNLKPRQIVQVYPGEFKDTSEIFRLTRNIINRLRKQLDGFQITQTNSLAYATIPVSKDQLRKQLDDFQITQTNSPAYANIPNLDENEELLLFALIRTTLEANDKALIGKTYSIQAGISQSKPAMFRGEPFNLPVRNPTDPLLFDVLLHTSENIELTSGWHKTLLYDPQNLNPQLVEFKFKIMTSGLGSLAINFYHERRWLKTIRFTFDTIVPTQLTTGTSEE